MNRKIIIKEEQNAEKNFFVIRQDVMKIAKEKGVPVTEILDLLIEDLKNFRNSDYEKKLDEISFDERVSDKVLNGLKLYINKMRKSFRGIESKEKKESKSEKMESDWRQIEESIDIAVLDGKQGTKKDILQRLVSDISKGNFEYNFTSKEKKFILKKLNGAIDEINKQEQEEKNKEETKKLNAEKFMSQIQEIVDREYEAGNITNKPNYLSKIRDAVTGKDKGKEQEIKMGDVAEQYLLQMLDEKIEIEKEELYFEQVRNFTKDFRFLRDFIEVSNARDGAIKPNKFTDKESYRRYTALREKLQREYDEKIGIKLILESGDIDETDKRILLARKEVIERKNEERRNGEVR